MPVCPGATGNIATEDLVYLLHGEGLSTGIDLDALIEVSHWLAERLGHSFRAGVQRAGDFKAVSAPSLGVGAERQLRQTGTRRGATVMAYRLGVDVGGTFTDVLVLEEEKGTLTLEKVLSTPEDQSVGVLAGSAPGLPARGRRRRETSTRSCTAAPSSRTSSSRSKGATGGLLTTRATSRSCISRARGRPARCTAGWA